MDSKTKECKPFGWFSEHVRNEEGQSIVLIALVFIVLLAFTALAVDAGLAFSRSSQFSRAVDAAALAGVVDLDPTANNTDRARMRAVQFLSANGWPTETLTVFDDSMSFTGSGLPQYSITVTWPVEFNFAKLIGLNELDITHPATAAYYSRAEIFVPTAIDDGRLRMASLYNVGRDGCTFIGDPIHPLRSSADPDSPNLNYVDLDGVYRYRIRIPDTYIDTNIVRIELFDPDSHNLGGGPNTAVITHTFAASYTHGITETLNCSSSGAGDKCVIRTGELLDGVFENPFWFLRVDETWNASCESDFGVSQGDTVNTFELYYLDDTGDRLPLARYTVDNGDSALTDMKWVVPGVTLGVDTDLNSFDIDISSVTAVDEDGYRHVYLDVTSDGGSSKNVWDIRAGPPPSLYVTPSVSELTQDVNLRNLQIANNPAPYGTDGIYVEALGYMPTQYYVNNESVKTRLTPIGVGLAKNTAYIRHFDYDSGAPPPEIAFAFDTFSSDPTDPSSPLLFQASIVGGNPDPGQYEATCNNGTNCDNSWSYPQYALSIPGVLYTGGILEATFEPNADAFVWSSSVVTGKPILTD